MDLITSAIICLCIYLVLLIVTVLLKFEDAYKLKGAHFILGVVNSLTMIIICIGLTCLDLQFMINDNNDYLVALYPFIALWNCQEMCSRRIPKILDRQESGSVVSQPS